MNYDGIAPRLREDSNLRGMFRIPLTHQRCQLPASSGGTSAGASDASPSKDLQTDQDAGSEMEDG